MRRGAVARALALLTVILGSLLLVHELGLPDVAGLRNQVDSAGTSAPLVFAAGYVTLALLPVPKGVLTALGGAMFGFGPGALLAWTAALTAAVLALELGRALGRDLVDWLTRGRLERVDRLLRDHGTGTVIALRLAPVIPYTAINYGAGVSKVGRRDYVVGSAVGMVPGSVAYAALGAYGSDPWKLGAAVAALVVLVTLGAAVGRRLSTRVGDQRDQEGVG
jgi:uncharacterized membrane protein YdjX (TVP38/TMEM64 family)